MSPGKDCLSWGWWKSCLPWGPGVGPAATAISWGAWPPSTTTMSTFSSSFAFAFVTLLSHLWWFCSNTSWPASYAQLVQIRIARSNFTHTTPRDSNHSFTLTISFSWFFLCAFNIRLWFNVFWNEFYARKGHFHTTIRITNSSLQLDAALSQNGQIAVWWQRQKGHEKCISETPHKEIQCVLSTKESNFNARIGQHFQIQFSPLTASLAVKYPNLLDDYQIDEKTSFQNMDKLFETDKMRYHVIFIPSLLGP